MPLLLAKSAMSRKPKLSAAHRAAHGLERKMQEYLLKELQALREGVPLDELTAALQLAKHPDVLRIIDEAGLRATFADLGPLLVRGAVAGAKTAGAVALDPLRPKIKDWMKRHTARLVKETTGTSREAIRSIVTAGVEAGRHPARLAKDVKAVIGLTDPQAVAVERRRAYLLGELPAERANQLADAYGDKLLERRALTIAHHESMSAIGNGRNLLWEQLKDDGGLGDDALQEWDSAIDQARCPICRAMHGQRRKVGEPFDAPDGTKIDVPQEIHVGCRCVANLV